MNKIKYFITIISLLFAMLVQAQSPDPANPYVSILAEPAAVQLNSNGILRVTIGNFGNGTIQANSLRVTISAGNNSEFLGIDPTNTNTKWTQTSLTTGTTNTIRLVNNALLNSFDIDDLLLTIKGTVIGPFSTITANLVYIAGTNPLIDVNFCGGTGPCQNSSQGNTVSGNPDDGSTTSLTVTSVLPLRLTSFTAANKNCNAGLAWKTANEVNTKAFEIQSSKDGINFTKATTVAAKGTGSGEYATIVTQANGNVFYRLKLIDRDGAFTYSEVIRLNLNCQAEAFMSLYPNPVVNGNNPNLSFSTTYKGKATIKLTSTLGQQIVATPIVVTEGVNNKTIFTSGLASGVYYITLTDNAGNIIGNTIKLIKQ